MAQLLTGDYLAIHQNYFDRYVHRRANRALDGS